MTDESALRTRRVNTVLGNLRAEEKGDISGVLATFAPGRVSYDLAASGTQLNGEAAARAYLGAMLTVLTDLQIEVVHLHHAQDSVSTELSIVATHASEYQGIAATGKRVTIRMCCIFRFEGDELWQQAVYLDNGSLKEQLLA
jgi:predicted ester cyclase